MKFLARCPLKAVTEIENELNIDFDGVVKILDTLQSDGLVERNGTGWELTRKGQEELKKEETMKKNNHV